MNITGYIVDFLKKGNNVEISGIGTLRIKSIPAQYQKETNTFNPAVRTIEFTSETVGDKKIISYIAEKECVPKDTAQKIWDNFVVALKEKLQNEGEHQFEDLGVLRFNPIGEVTFVTNSNINLLENTFGLQELTGVNHYSSEPLRVNPFDYNNSSLGENSVLSEEKINIVSEKTVLEEESLISKKLKEIVQQLDEQDKPIVEEVSIVDAVEEIEKENKTIEENIEKIDEVIDESPDIIDEFADDVDERTIQKNQLDELHEEKPLSIIEDIIGHIVVEPVTSEEPKKEKEEAFVDNDQSEDMPRKKRKSFLWIIILCLLLIGTGVYYYFTSIKGTQKIKVKTETFFTQDVEEKLIGKDSYSTEQFLLKEVIAGKQIQNNERLYNESGIFSMNPIEENLMIAYFLANPEYLKKTELEPIVKPKQGTKIEKVPVRRKVNIPVKSRSDYEFDLIAGIFRVKSNALKHADDVAQYGIDPYIVEVPKNGTTFYYVSLGGRKTYTEVEALKANYRNLRGVDMAITKW